MPFVATIAQWLLERKLVGSLSLAQRAAKVGLAAAACILFAVGVIAWFHFHDRGVIAKHDAKVELGQAKSSIESEHRATAAAAPRDASRAAAAEQSNTAMEQAEHANPQAAAAAAGPVTRAAAQRFPVRP